MNTIDTETDASVPTGINETDLSELRAGLFQAGAIREGSRAERLLVYLVTAEIEGKGDKLNAYSIAMDVLGRGADFDPASDSIVRVELGRLRRVLKNYYSGPGAGHQRRITVPLGQSRPDLVVDTSKKGKRLPLSSAPDKSRAWARTVVLFFVAVTLLIAGWSVFSPRQQSPARTTQGNTLEAPIVELGPFRSLVADEALSFLAPGLRAHLLVELSRFDTLQVRDNPNGAEIGPNMRASDYLLIAELHGWSDDLDIFFQLTDLATMTISWSDTLDFEIDDTGFRDRLLKHLYQTVQDLAGPHGEVAREALERREATLFEPGAPGETYSCYLRWLAWDLTKATEQEPKMRACISRLIENNTRDGTIWAAHGFLTFLDWSRTGADLGDLSIKTALEAAEKGVRLSPRSAEAHEYLGSILLALGRHNDALSAYSIAAELNPSKPDLRVLTGWQLALTGNWDEGIPIVEDGIASAVRAPGWFRIPMALDSLRRGNYAAALEQAELIVAAGDDRGRLLAIAASDALNDPGVAEIHVAALESSGRSVDDALAELHNLFPEPEILSTLEGLLAFRLRK